MKVKISKISGEAILPSYAHPGDAGMDLYSVEETELLPGERKLVGTGIKIALENGYEAQVRPKSGLAIKEGITVLNTPGTIDAGYRGEVKVILVNLSDRAFGIKKGQKIAQMVFAKVEEAELEEVEELDETSRNDGGFGSTGLQ
ncbi:MAG: dUTP diphosphatase [Candidatus Diapherotrites archaeon]